MKRTLAIGGGVLIAAALWVFSFRSAPLFEDDFARYLWEGRMLLAGHNPYLLAPSTALDKMHDAASWALYEKLSFREVAAVYPPPVLGMFALAIAAFGAQLWAIKLLVVVFLLAALLAAVPLLRRAGVAPAWLLLFALHPLVLKEILNSAHFEPLLLLPLVLSYRAGLEGRTAAAALYLGLAASVRFYPLLFLPLYVGRWRGRDFLLCLALVAFCLSPLVLSGGGGWGDFSRYWVFNDGLFGLLAWAGRAAAVDPWWPKVGAAVLYGAHYVAIFFAWRRGRLSLAEAHLLAVFTLLLLSPVVNPWYLLWLFPFVFLAPMRPAFRLAAIVWSGTVFVAYSHWALGSTPLWLRALEYLPVWGLLLWGVTRTPPLPRDGAPRPSPRPKKKYPLTTTSWMFPSG